MKTGAASLQDRLGRIVVLAVPYLWMAVFFLLPFLILLRISFSETRIGIPPYTEVFNWLGGLAFEFQGTLSNYAFLFTDSLYLAAYGNSVKVAAISTLLCLLIGYPMALGISRVKGSLRTVLLMMVIVPLWTSFLIRVYAWIGLLKPEGLINAMLIWIGLIDQPLALLHSSFAVYLGITYSYLPFMVLPLYATLEKQDHSILEAAADLGDKAEELGVCFHYNVTIEGFAMEQGRIVGVDTTEGRQTADRYVCAMGPYAPILLKTIGIRLPIYPIKGYSITMPITDPDAAPRSTIMDETHKVAITRLGDRIRVAGQAEIIGYNKNLGSHATDSVRYVVNDLFPKGGDLSQAQGWTGLRPMTPDGTPVIGPTRYDNLFLNTGHGTLGWTMSCGSARVVADLVMDRKPDIDMDGLTAARYGQ